MRRKRASRRRRGVATPMGKVVLEIGDIGAAGLPALGGQGDPGAAAGRERRGRRAMASATENWRWPAPRIPASRACRAGGGRCSQSRARRARAGMRRALADRAMRRPLRWPAAGTVADGAAQQLLRQACRLSLHLLPHRHRRIAAMSAPAMPFQEMVREAMEDVTGAAHGAENRGIDGCSIPTYAVPLKKPCARLRPMATGTGFGRSAPGRRSGCWRPAWPSRSSSPAPDAADTS